MGYYRSVASRVRRHSQWRFADGGSIAGWAEGFRACSKGDWEDRDATFRTVRSDGMAGGMIAQPIFLFHSI